MKKTFAALALATVLTPFSSAQAEVISYSASKAMTTTNWNSFLSFNKFDSSLGTLTSIKFDLTGVVQGYGEAESFDAEATTVTLSLGSLLTLTRPDASSIVVTNPVFKQVFEFTEYDGERDYGGTSGGNTGTVEAAGANFFVSTASSDFALFSALGGGMLDLGLKADGASTGVGAGNLATFFRTSAAGSATVTYEYTPFAEVPEPASMALVLGGLGLLGLSRRRVGSKA